MGTFSISQGNFFLRPLPLVAVVLMALNDHVLKYRYPGLVTGKLSDFLGVFYFPIFLLALVVLLPGRGTRLSRVGILVAIALTDSLLIGVKTSPAIAAWVSAVFHAWLFDIKIAADPTDLWALTMNPVSYWYLARFLPAPPRR